MEYKSDQVDLIRMWLNLWRFKIHFLITFVAITALSLTAIAIVPEIYRFRMSIDIGPERVEHALAKLRDVHLPLVVQQHNQKSSTHLDARDFRLVSSANSNIINIETKGRADRAAEYKTVLQNSVQLLLDDHERVTNIDRVGTNLKISEAELALEFLRTEQDVSASKLSGLSDLRAFYEQHAKETMDELAQASRRLAAIIERAQEDSGGLTLLILAQSEAEKARVRLADIQTKILDIRSERAELEAKITKDKGAAKTKELEILFLQAKRDSVPITRVVLEPSQSDKPVGVGRSLLTILAVFAGLLGASLSVFGASVVSRTRAAISAVTAGRGESSARGG